jgi:hypothetical protein
MNGNGKIVGVIVKWVLGLISAIVIGLATLAYNTLQASIDDVAATVEESKQDIKGLDIKLDAAILSDGIQDSELKHLTEKINLHIEREGP